MPKPITETAAVVETEAQAQDENLVPVRRPKAKAKKAPAKATKAAAKKTDPDDEARKAARRKNTAIPLAERESIFLGCLKKLGAVSAQKAVDRERIGKAANGKLFPADIYGLGRDRLFADDQVKQVEIDGQGLCYFITAKGLKALGK